LQASIGEGVEDLDSIQNKQKTMKGKMVGYIAPRGGEEFRTFSLLGNRERIRSYYFGEENDGPIPLLIKKGLTSRGAPEDRRQSSLGKWKVWPEGKG